MDEKKENAKNLKTLALLVSVLLHAIKNKPTVPPLYPGSLLISGDIFVNFFCWLAALKTNQTKDGLAEGQLNR